MLTLGHPRAVQYRFESAGLTVPPKLSPAEAAALSRLFEHVLRMDSDYRRVLVRPVESREMFDRLTNNAKRCALPVVLAEATRVRHSAYHLEMRGMLEDFVQGGPCFEPGLARSSTNALLPELILAVTAAAHYAQGCRGPAPDLVSGRVLDAALNSAGVSRTGWRAICQILFPASPPDHLLLAALGSHAASPEVREAARSQVVQYLEACGLPLPDDPEARDHFLFKVGRSRPSRWGLK